MIEHQYKITIVSTFNPYYVSSASANRWRAIIDGMVFEGIAVSMIITQGYQSPAEFVGYQEAARRHDIDVCYTLSIVNNTPLKRRLSMYLTNWITIIYNRHNVYRHIHTFKSDMVMLIPTPGVISLFNAALLRKMPDVILGCELNEFHDIGHVHATNILQRIMYKNYKNRLEKTVLPKLDVLLVMTKTLYRHYSNFTNSMCKILHYPMTVDFDRFDITKIIAFETAVEKPYIVYVGALNNKKDGIDILLESFSLIKDKYPQHNVCLIGGHHPDIAIQQEIIRRNHLDDRVIYLGLKSRDEIPALLRHADLCLLPRPDSRQAQGGFPTKLGEYLASGTPSVVTSVGEISEYLVDNVSAFIASPGCIDSFAEAMDRALSDPKKSAEIGKRGQQVAFEHFNMANQARLFKSFIEEYTRG